MRLRLRFEPRDLWVGIYWEREDVASAGGAFGTDWRVYVCVLPMLPLRISWTTKGWA